MFGDGDDGIELLIVVNYDVILLWILTMRMWEANEFDEWNGMYVTRTLRTMCTINNVILIFLDW